MSMLEDEQESWRLLLEEAEREGEFTNMVTRTYVFLVEKPDDSYEQRVEALSLADARDMMHQESQKQPDWLSYRLLDIIDHDEDEDEESES